MAPSAIRQGFLWGIPSVVILLSFLWFKRKKSAIRSDPGEKKLSTKMGDSKVNNKGSSSKSGAIDQKDGSMKSNRTVICLEEETASQKSVPSVAKNIIECTVQSENYVMNSSEVKEKFSDQIAVPDFESPVEELTQLSLEEAEEETKVEAEEETKVEAEEETIVEAEAVTVCGDRSPEENACRGEDPVQVPTGAKAEADMGAYGEAEIGAETEANAGAYGGAEIGAETEANAGAYGGADIGAETEADIGAYGGADIGACGGADAGAYAEADTGAEVEADAGAEAGAERDSANHSPAEVMMASPSMSNYSDVHSERSSDSGKGCSYANTPPSRTPVSCSSLSGDTSAHSVYEFVIPQQLVGRLIGRHGSFIHQIKTKANALIFIKRHPDTSKLKICAVEGTQMDIESALEMIREKFPIKRYPSVTLEQVCFLPPNPTMALLQDYLQLRLVEGVNNDVILSSLVSPVHFFLQQPTHPTFPALNQLTTLMNMVYKEPEAPPLLDVKVSIICVAPALNGWYRSQVVSVDAENKTSMVKFVDYGGYLSVENSQLRQIRSDFMTLPFQAAECYLAHVVPPGGPGGSWSHEARAYVEALTRSSVLQAQVCGYAEDGVPVVFLYASRPGQVIPIHQELVAQGLAEWWEPSEPSETSES